MCKYSHIPHGQFCINHLWRGRQRGGIKMKLDRKKRALVRALAELGKWDAKEIAAVFDVSLLPIKRTVANDYPSVDDKPWEDGKFYEKSDLEQLISMVSLEKLCLSNSCMTFAAAVGCQGEREKTQETEQTEQSEQSQETGIISRDVNACFSWGYLIEH